MKEITHKYKDDWVILRFDDKDIDWRKNNKTEYRTGRERRRGVANAKLYWHEEDADQALVALRIKRRRDLSTN